jgi:glycerol-3-phosphate dehydrogenase (NAD(P)+)
MRLERIQHFGIIGGGAWGTAIAILAAHNIPNVLMWTREEVVANEINQYHTNSRYLKNCLLPINISATTEILALNNCEAVVLAVPAQSIREVAQIFADSYYQQHSKKYSGAIIIAAKGIEVSTDYLLSQVVEEICPKAQIAILSGPNFAHEIALGNALATASLACQNQDLGKKLITALTTDSFKAIWSSDVIGVQLCGALKNVLAIGCGCLRGIYRNNDNPHAAILTAGIKEIARLLEAMGGMPQTLFIPAGIGDIVLTCYGEKSRNMSFGQRLATNEITDPTQTVEGKDTAKAVQKLIKKYNLNLPIISAIYQVLHKSAKPSLIVEALKDSSV